MRRKKKSNSIYKKTGYWVIGLLVAFVIGFEAYRMVAAWLIERKADKEWPTRDLTSGSYSSDYDGIDISKHQGRIHWDELSQVKRLQFIFIKATEGADIKDPNYDKNIKQARKHGIPVGSYLWIASYNHEPVLPGAPHYDIWQFHRHGRVPGVWNWVDLNKFAEGRSIEDIKFN